MVTEKPVGICPSCGNTVFASRETDGPVWICPADLNPKNAYWSPSEVTEDMKEKDGDYSCCPSSHCLDGGYCEIDKHMPLHSACYNKGDY